MSTPISSKFKVAIVQLRSGRNPGANIETACMLIGEAAALGAEYVLTPEDTVLLEVETDRLFANVQGEEGHFAIARFAELASELAIWLHIGSLPIRLDGRKVANRSYLFAPDGRIAARYSKIHMFDVDLPGGESYRESQNFKAGNKAVLASLPWGMLGMTICYDLRFASLYRALARAGADFITVPAAFTKVTGEAHWHILLRARAIETGCFIFAAAQGGHHEAGRDTYGHSLIIDPWGEILAEAGIEPGVISADIDVEKVAKVRRRIPALACNPPYQVLKEQDA